MQETSYMIYLQNFALGDVNADGIIDAEDATAILIYSAEFGAGEVVQRSTDWLNRANYNQDGEIDAEDATEILIYSANEGAGLLKTKIY